MPRRACEMSRGAAFTASPTRQPRWVATAAPLRVRPRCRGRLAARSSTPDRVTMAIVLQGTPARSRRTSPTKTSSARCSWRRRPSEACAVPCAVHRARRRRRRRADRGRHRIPPLRADGGRTAAHGQLALRPQHPRRSREASPVAGTRVAGGAPAISSAEYADDDSAVRHHASVVRISRRWMSSGRRSWRGSPAGAGDFNAPLIGATIEAVFDARSVGQAARPVSVSLAARAVASVTIDFARLE